MEFQCPQCSSHVEVFAKGLVDAWCHRSHLKPVKMEQVSLASAGDKRKSSDG